jgi:hypothetical protein
MDITTTIIITTAVITTTIIITTAVITTTAVRATTISTTITTATSTSTSTSVTDNSKQKMVLTHPSIFDVRFVTSLIGVHSTLHNVFLIVSNLQSNRKLMA